MELLLFALMLPPPEVNKAEIESKAKQSYETQLKIIEAEHRAELRSLEAHYQDKIIKLHEKQVSDMMEIAKLLASRPYYISKKQRGLNHDSHTTYRNR